MAVAQVSLFTKKQFQSLSTGGKGESQKQLLKHVWWVVAAVFSQHYPGPVRGNGGYCWRWDHDSFYFLSFKTDGVRCTTRETYNLHMFDQLHVGYRSSSPKFIWEQKNGSYNGKEPNKTNPPLGWRKTCCQAPCLRLYSQPSFPSFPSTPVQVIRQVGKKWGAWFSCLAV